MNRVVMTCIVGLLLSAPAVADEPGPFVVVTEIIHENGHDIPIQVVRRPEPPRPPVVVNNYGHGNVNVIGDNNTVAGTGSFPSPVVESTPYYSRPRGVSFGFAFGHRGYRYGDQYYRHHPDRYRHYRYGGERYYSDRHRRHRYDDDRYRGRYEPRHGHRYSRHRGDAHRRHRPDHHRFPKPIRKLFDR